MGSDKEKKFVLSACRPENNQVFSEVIGSTPANSDGKSLLITVRKGAVPSKVQSPHPLRSNKSSNPTEVKKPQLYQWF